VTAVAGLITPERVALRLLAGCPAGATLDALAANGVTEQTIARLVADGHAALRVHRIVSVGPVVWVFLTGAGLDQLHHNPAAAPRTKRGAYNARR
jgi:hypothetical protein